MRTSFIDIPRFVATDVYQQAIDRMLECLKDFPGIVSIYQVGGVSTPGISDIDLFVVFEDKVKVEKNPLENLSSVDLYLFTHHLFGTSERFIGEIEQYTCFGNYKLLSGREQPMQQVHISEVELAIIKKQVALEYLLRGFIASTIEQINHTIKIRNLFLHVKALLIDLSFLGIDSGKLADAISEIMEARNKWFEHKPDNKRLEDLAHHYHAALDTQLRQLLKKEKFYLPEKANLQISKNVFLKPAAEFSVPQEGLLFPGMIAGLHPLIPKLLNQVRRFNFYLPVQQQALPEIISKRYRFMNEMVHYRKSYLPHFVPLGVGLNIFK